MRPLALDIILLLAPLMCGVAAFAIGMRAVRWPVRARVAVIATPTVLAVALVVAVRLAPGEQSRWLALLGGTTVVMCMVTLLLLGAAWGAPKRTISSGFLGAVAAIALVVVLVQSSGPMHWRTMGADAWDRFPDADGTLRQSSGASCAAASGAMLLGALGVKASEGQVAYLASTTVLGTDAEALAFALQELMPDGALVEVSRSWPEEHLGEGMPFISYQGGTFDGHAVVIVPTHISELEVLDPLDGTRRATSVDEVRRDWSGVAVVPHAARRP